MKALLVKLGLFVAVLSAIGLLVAASGVIPLRASAGHWPPTRWFLSFTMERSVSTWAVTTPHRPDLEEPARVLRGAGHYETGCRPCHGAPSRPRSEIARELTPEPPYLPEIVSEWSDDELFQLVRHGIKMTGMPAWPARHRGDEVWDVVAFLRTLPTLDAETYAELALGDAAPPTADDEVAVPESASGTVARSCARCHGRDGSGRGGAFPKLAGQKPEYLAASLLAYARGIRHSGIMEPLAAGLDPAQIAELARHYAAEGSGGPARPVPRPAPGEPYAPAGPADDDEAPSAARGEAIARRGVPERKVPACVHCHGPAERRLNDRYPVLAGQPAEYLALQLRLFRDDHRGGTAEYAHVMSVVTRKLTDRDIRDLAAWYSALPTPSGEPAAPPTPGRR